MSIVRVREGLRASIYDPAHDVYVPLTPGKKYDADDPFVRANAWAFESDVESASAAPGEKRSVGRPRKDVG